MNISVIYEVKDKRVVKYLILQDNSFMLRKSNLDVSLTKLDEMVINDLEIDVSEIKYLNYIQF